MGQCPYILRFVARRGSVRQQSGGNGRIDRRTAVVIVFEAATAYCPQLVAEWPPVQPSSAQIADTPTQKAPDKSPGPSRMKRA
jgi:hypothetical protein